MNWTESVKKKPNLFWFGLFWVLSSRHTLPIVVTLFFLYISEDDFQRLQNSFLEKYYLEFEDTEENKFSYTDIHREYVSWYFFAQESVWSWRQIPPPPTPQLPLFFKSMTSPSAIIVDLMSCIEYIR